ncbi:hypothetical protein ACGFWE_30610 [Streptomyces sp. NPDC048523]|uniref:hypothetical protein n=1 Tax=unclassified Streptomyces TaxID=2593676 RepID=UPI00333431C6
MEDRQVVNDRKTVYPRFRRYALDGVFTRARPPDEPDDHDAHDSICVRPKFSNSAITWCDDPFGDLAVAPAANPIYSSSGFEKKNLSTNKVQS